MNEKILLVNHSGLNASNEFWAPPGGGLQFGENVHECLLREFKEETGLDIQVGDFICVSEYLKSPLHAVELFFFVIRVGGELISGFDPETSPEDQIIKTVQFLSINELNQIPESNKHNLLKSVSSFDDLMSKNGYSKFPAGGEN